MAANPFDQNDDYQGPSAVEGSPLPGAVPANMFDANNDYESRANMFDANDPAEWPEQAAPPPESIEGDPLMSDYGKSIMGMGAATGAGMGWLVEKMGGLVRYKGEKISEPLEEVGRMLKERGMESSRMWMEEKMEAVGIDEAGLSPQARVAMQQELLGEAITSESKFNKLKLMAAGSMLGTMIGMGAGRVITAGLQRAGMASKTAATIGYSTGEAGVAAPAAGAATEEEVMSMPLEELQESLEYQAAYGGLSGYDSEEERVQRARELIAKAAGGSAAAMTMISTFVLSAPFGSRLDKLVGGGGAKSATIGGRAAGTARGAATEGTQEFFQSGSEKVSENIAMIGAGFDRDVFEGALEEALGGAGSGALMGGPFGYRLDQQAVADEHEAALAEIERIQKEAEAAAAAAGGDMLDVVLAGEEAAADFAEQIVSDLREQEQLDRDFVLTKETVVGGPEVDPTADLTDDEVAAEIETELEREQIQREAGETYVAQNIEQLRRQKEEELSYAEKEAEDVAQREAETKEAEYQKELQKGEGVAQIEEAGVDAAPATTTLAEAGLASAKRKRASKKEVNLEARRILEKAKNQPPLLEDQRPSTVVVDPTGAARPMSAAEVDSQIKRRWEAMEQLGLDLKDPKTNIKVRVNDVTLGIENPKGSTRNGTNPDGTEWSQTFRGAHYGNIEGVRGADNERLDVYVGEQSWSPLETRQKVWVINQYKPDGTFDEHKVMMGFADELEATSTFDEHNGGNMPRGEVVEMSMKEFKQWAFDGQRKNKPLAPPAVQTVGGMADLIAAQDRATGKGRRRPKIVYRKGDAKPLKPDNVETGKPVRFPFLKNSEKAPNLGARFGQDVEPAGNYVVPADSAVDPDKLPPGWSAGEQQLDNPLVLPWGDEYQSPGNWKQTLSRRYGGKTGKALSNAVRADGYDGIITVRDGYVSETVILEAPPKILYRKGDEAIEFTPGQKGPIEFEKTAPLEDDTVGHLVQRKNGKPVAVITLRNGPGGNLQISRAEVSSDLRGQGIGKQMILEAVRYANKQGRELVSDNTVSVAQLRAYESLRKSGQLVIEYAAPERVYDALDNEAADFSVMYYTPVITRMFIPSYTQEIAYRKSEQMVSEKIDRGAVGNVINLLMKFMPGIQSRVFVAETWEDLPAIYRAELERTDNTDARGFYDPETNKVFVIVQNHPNAGAAVQTFMHEAVGHYGMQKVFGKDFMPLLDDIWENGNRKAMLDVAERYGLDLTKLEDRRTAVEEYIAHLAETSPKATVLQKVVNYVRDMLRKAGVLSSWTDNDIHSLLRNVRRELRFKPLNKIKLTTEAEIEETGEVVTLEQTADVALRRHDKRADVVKKLRDCVA